MKKLSLILCLLLVLIGTTAAAQTTSRPSQATTKLPTAAQAHQSNGQAGVTLSFKDVDIRVFIQFVAKLTGKTYVISDKVAGKVTVITPGPVSLKEALRIFESVLEVKGFATVQAGHVVKVVPSREARWQGGKIISQGRRAPTETEEIVTKVVSLEHTSADQLKRGLRPLAGLHANIAAYTDTNSLVITDTASNIRRLSTIIRALDRPGALSTIKVVPLKHATAKDLAKSLDKLFSKVSRPTSRSKSAAKTISPVVSLRVMADERTNSLILLGPKADIRHAMVTIQELDRAEAEAQFNIHVIRLKYAVAEEVAKIFNQLAGVSTARPSTTRTTTKKGQVQAADKVKILSGQVKVVADPATNSLIVSASPSEFKVIEAIAKQLDIRRTMVYVETVILEMSATKALEFGVDWIAAGSNSRGVIHGGFGGQPSSSVGQASDSPKPGFSFGVIGETINFGGLEIPNLSALLKAVQTDSDIRVVATPQILTADNEEATIQVATNLPFVTRVDQGTTDTDRTVQVFEYRDVGYTLKVTPRISDSENVRLNVETEAKGVVSAQTQDSSGQTLLAPTTTVRTAKTVVLSRNNEIVAIGGLIDQRAEETGSKVPCLGNVPVLGWGFKNTQDTGTRTNLLIFLSPHILATPEDVRAKTDEKIEAARKLDVDKPEDILTPFRPKFDRPDFLKKNSKEVPTTQPQPAPEELTEETLPGATEKKAQ